MRKPGQMRRATKRKINKAIVGFTDFPIGMPSKKKTLHSKTKNKPKQPTQTQRAKLRESLQKAGLQKTTAGRRSERAAMTKFLGYEQPRLSMAVGRKMPDGTIKPGKASRYTRRGTRPVYEMGTEMRPGERVARRNWLGEIETDAWGDIIYDYGPDRKVLTGKKLVGETFVAKRVSKKGSGKSSSKRGEGATIFGSTASRRSMARTVKLKRKKSRGGRTKKEKMKKKKKK